MCIWCWKFQPYRIQHAICAALCCFVLFHPANNLATRPGACHRSSWCGDFSHWPKQLRFRRMWNSFSRSAQNRTHAISRRIHLMLYLYIFVIMCLCLVLKDYVPKMWKLKGGRSNMQSETKHAEQRTCPCLGFQHDLPKHLQWDWWLGSAIHWEPWSERLQRAANMLNRTISAAHQRIGEQMLQARFMSSGSA
jgi:hypothetical protein